jgi:hypothetical protein
MSDKREVLPGQEPCVFHGDRPSLAINLPVRPPTRPDPETVRVRDDKPPATLKIAIGPRGVTDAGVPNPAATAVIPTKQPVQDHRGAVVAGPTGEPSKSRTETAHRDPLWCPSTPV